MTRLLRTVFVTIWRLIDGPVPEPPKPRSSPSAALLNAARGHPRLWVQDAGLPALIGLTLLLSQVLWLLLPQVGVYANQCALAALLVLGLRREPVRRLALCAAILPSMNILVVLFGTPDPSLQLAVAYVSLLGLSLVYRFIFARDQSLSSQALSRRDYIAAIPLVIVIGPLLGITAALLIGRSSSFIAASPLSHVLAIACLGAVTEEVFFRGLIQQWALKLLHPVTAVALTALLYLLFSIDPGNWRTIGPALLSGTVLSVVYGRRQNLMLTTMLNLTGKLVFIGLALTYLH